MNCRLTYLPGSVRAVRLLLHRCFRLTLCQVVFGGLLGLLLVNGQGGWAQAPAWQAAAVIVGQGDATSLVKASAADAQGNVYLVGTFSDKVTFDGIVLQAVGSADAFVAKWSSTTKRFEWAQRAGGAGQDEFTAIALAAGRVYVTGNFTYSSRLDFGGLPLAPVLTPATFRSEAFLATLTDAGRTSNFEWAQQLSTGAAVAAVAVYEHLLYVAGSFRGTLALATPALDNAGQSGTDIFVAKFVDVGPTAQCVWARAGGGAEDDQATALAVNGPNVYVTGTYSSLQATFGSTNLRNGNPDYSSSDGFVAKLTDTGPLADFTWAIAVSSQDVDDVVALAVQANRVYVAGNMFVTSRPRSVGHFGAVELASHNRRLLLVARLTDEGATGQVDWVATDEGGNQVNALAARGTSIYIVGTAQNPGSVGGYVVTHPMAPGTYRLTSPSPFLAKLTDLGTTASYTWVQHTSEDGFGLTVAAGGPGQVVYAAGTNSSTYDLGNPTVPGVNKSFLTALTDQPAPSSPYAADLSATSLFPNPASGMAMLRLPAVPGATHATITWYSALGQLVRTQQVALAFPDTRLDLRLADLAAGPYLLRIEVGNQQLVRTLLVQ